MKNKLTKLNLEMVSNQFKILSEPMRLSILQELRNQEKCVSDLTTTLQTSQANISKHLSLLTGANMVSRRKDGLKVFYSISSPEVLGICDIICGKIENDLKTGLQQIK